MRKITSFMLMLLCAMTAWAQTTIVDTDGNAIQPNQLYRLKHMYSGDKYLHITQYNAAEKIQIKGVSNSADQFFAFIPTENANEYNIKSASGYFIQNTGAWNCKAVTSGPTPYEISEKEEGLYLLHSEQGYFGTNEGTTADGSPVYTNHPEDRNGATWKFEKVKDVVVNTLEGFNPQKMYTVTTTTRGGWSVGATSGRFESTTDGGLGTTVDPTNTRNQFAVLSDSKGNYYLYSVHAQKFVKADQTTVDGVADPIKFTDASSFGAGRVLVSFKNIENKYINLGGSNQMVINAWGGGNNEIDGGNAVLFLECGDFDSTEALEKLSNVAVVTYNFVCNDKTLATQTVEVSKGSEFPAFDVTLPLACSIAEEKPEGNVNADVTEDITVVVDNSLLPFEPATSYEEITKWYYLKNKGTFYLSHVENQDYIALGDNQNTVDLNNKDAFSWAFVGDPVNGFKIVNKATGEGYVLSSTTNLQNEATTYPVMTELSTLASGNNEYWVLTGSAHQTNGFYIEQKGHSNNKMNNRDSKLAYWTGGADNGSTFTVELRDDDAEFDALITLLGTAIEKVQSLKDNIGEGLGQYSAPENLDSRLEAIVAFRDGINQETTIVELETKVTEIEDLIASFLINKPVAGKYYTFKNDTYYITSGVTDGGKIALSETEDASVIYYYDGTHLLAYSTGLYFGLNENDWTFEAVGSNEISAIEFVAAANGALGKYNVKSGGRWLHRTDAYVNRCSSNPADHPEHNWTIEEVESLPVTITAAKYATFYAPVAVTVPAGVTAHTVTINGDWATLSEALEVIPANTGVVLQGEANTYNFAITNTTTTVDSDLTGTVAATYITEDAYVLSNGANGIGFYGAIMNQNAGNATNEIPAFLNNSHKAYLPMTEGMNAVAYSFRNADVDGDDDATAIEEVETENAEVVIYDLAGRRINEITEGGIYIVNGNKVLVK